MKEITADQLREVMTANPAATNKALATALNVGLATFIKKVRQPELKSVYDELKTVRRGGNRRAAAKRAKRATPPRNGNAKGRVSDELLRKLKLEFEHITLYDEKTIHFDEIAEELRTIR